LTQKLAIKIYASLKLNFHLSIDSSFITDPPVVLNTEPVLVLESTDIAHFLKGIFESFTSKIEAFSMRESGWVLNKLLYIQLHVAEFQPLQASATFELPKEIHDKKAVVNIRNTCNQCFLYSVSAAKFSSPDEANLERPAKHKRHFGRFNLQGLTFPMQVKDIPKFEKLNDVSISVYGWVNKTDKMWVMHIPLKCLKM
jgi:hypothetical protein